MLRCVLVVFLISFALGSKAQTFGEVEDRQTNVESYFFHVLPGESTMQVYVWGTVRGPGLYVVSEATDLGELLSLAGGPAIMEINDNDKREVTIRLYHTEGGARTIAYEAQMEEMISEPGAYPPLQDGDVVEVATHDIKGFNWRDIFSVVGAVAAVALVVDRVVSISTSN